MKQEVYVMQYGEGLIQEMPNGDCNWFFRPTDKRGNISNAQLRLKEGKAISKQSAFTDIQNANRWAGYSCVINKAWNNE
jgi:hypothetical protein